MEGRKLYKSRTDKKLDGVCGGIAAYFKIDSTLVRIVWLLLGFTVFGIFAYIVCAALMPREPEVIDYRDGPERRRDEYDDHRN